MNLNLSNRITWYTLKLRFTPSFFKIPLTGFKTNRREGGLMDKVNLINFNYAHCSNFYCLSDPIPRHWNHLHTKYCFKWFLQVDQRKNDVIEDKSFLQSFSTVFSVHATLATTAILSSKQKKSENIMEEIKNLISKPLTLNAVQ